MLLQTLVADRVRALYYFVVCVSLCPSNVKTITQLYFFINSRCMQLLYALLLCLRFNDSITFQTLLMLVILTSSTPGGWSSWYFQMVTLISTITRWVFSGHPGSSQVQVGSNKILLPTEPLELNLTCFSSHAEQLIFHKQKNKFYVATVLHYISVY